MVFSLCRPIINLSSVITLRQNLLTWPRGWYGDVIGPLTSLILKLRVSAKCLKLREILLLKFVWRNSVSHLTVTRRQLSGGWRRRRMITSSLNKIMPKPFLTV